MTMHSRIKWTGAGAALAVACGAAATQAQIGPVFVIAMENHNWEQPTNKFTGGTQQIFQNPAAPYINSLVTPGDPNAQYVSYAPIYRSVGAAVHPSEPNYIWSEAGTNFGITNDNQPFGTGGTNQNTTQHLTGLMQASGQSWKSYQEEIDHTSTSGGVNTPGNNSLNTAVAVPANWTVPLTNFSGTSATYTNPYNGSHQYDYAAKHNPQVFFTDTNGGNNNTSTNPLASKYAPLEQLSSDLTNNTFAKYNFITPDQFNDMHTSLAASFNFTYGGTTYTNTTSDPKKIAQGDQFLSILVPMIMASDAFQNQNATIVLWNDETEGETAGTIGQFSSMEIVISKLAKGNGYASPLTYSHSSDLRTWQELFNLETPSETGFLGAAAGANDLSDLFQAGAIANAGVSTIPEPASLCLMGVGAAALLKRRRRA